MSIRSFLLTIFIFLSMHEELAMAREVLVKKVKLNRAGALLNEFMENGDQGITKKRHAGAATGKAVAEEDNGESIGKTAHGSGEGLSSTNNKSVMMQIKSSGSQTKSQHKNVGFEYDYSRPKMHPPSHN